MTTLKELAAVRQEYINKLNEAGKDAVHLAAKDVFNAHPNVMRLEWTQYTPYFNDGDPCEFRVHDVFALSVEDDSDARYAEESKHLLKITKGWGKDRKVLLPAVEEFEKLIHANEDLLQTLGEGKVVITRSGGIVVEDYDHD